MCHNGRLLLIGWGGLNLIDWNRREKPKIVFITFSFLFASLKYYVIHLFVVYSFFFFVFFNFCFCNCTGTVLSVSWMISFEWNVCFWALYGNKCWNRSTNYFICSWVGLRKLWAIEWACCSVKFLVCALSGKFVNFNWSNTNGI